MVGYTGCAQKLLTNFDQRGALFFISFFMKTGTSADSYYVPNVILTGISMDTGGHLDFLNIFVKKYPHPLKPEAMASICKMLIKLNLLSA